MTQWGNEQVPTDVYNAAVSAGHKYGKDEAQAKQITNTLLGIGKYESGWNYAAVNVSDKEASYGWLQFNRGVNGSTGFGTPYSVEQLMNPQLEADVAAEHIARNLNSGTSLFDSLWPWTNTRVNGLALAASVNATPASVNGSGTNNPAPANACANVPSGIINNIKVSMGSMLKVGKDPAYIANALKALYPNIAVACLQSIAYGTADAIKSAPDQQAVAKLGGIDAIGKFFSDVEGNAPRLGLSVVAVVLVTGGIFLVAKGVTKRA